MIAVVMEITLGSVWDVVVQGADVAGFVAACLTLLVVLEMRRARDQAINPELIVLPPIYKYDYRWVPSENLQPVLQPELPEGEENPFMTRLPVFGLKNLGNAPALNVKSTWTMLGEPIKKVLLASSVISDYSYDVEKGLFSLQRENAKWATTCWDNETSEFPYCIGSPTNESVSELPVPFKIGGSIELRLAAIERPSDIAYITGPSIEIDLEYMNGDGKKYTRTFLAKSTFSYIPDAVSSSRGSVTDEHKHPHNIRGSLKFIVNPVAKK